MKKKTYDTRTVGVLAKGGKVLDDLAAMGYVAAELASWVGPISEVVPQEVVGGTTWLLVVLGGTTW